MKIDESFHFPADPDTVVEMLTDPQFQRRAAEASGALRCTVDLSADGAGPAISVTRTLPVSGVPDVFGTFVKDSVDVTEALHWDAPHGAGRSATLTLTFHAGPMALRGTMTLEPAVDPTGSTGGTAGRLSGDLKCGLPFIGGKAEKALAPQVVKALRTQVETGTAWLAERR